MVNKLAHSVMLLFSTLLLFIVGGFGLFVDLEHCAISDAFTNIHVSTSIQCVSVKFDLASVIGGVCLLAFILLEGRGKDAQVTPRVERIITIVGYAVTVISVGTMLLFSVDALFPLPIVAVVIYVLFIGLTLSTILMTRYYD